MSDASTAPAAAPRPSRPIRIHTDLLPSNVRAHEHDEAYRDVVVVIDVLRTCTVVPVLFDGGMASVRLSPSLGVARRAAAADGDLLIGERRGVPPEGFNHGNSPAVLAEHGFDGRRAILVSENAPAALPAMHGARTLLLASLANAAAVCEHAAAEAETRIDLVCCGFAGAPDLDDLAGAGLIADGLLRRLPRAHPSGATELALGVLRTSPDPIVPLWGSRAGRYLRRLGLERDVGLAADVDRSSVVPRMDAPQDAHGGTLYPFRAAGA